MIITISGYPGSGKSKQTKFLDRALSPLGYKYFRAGEYFRKMAEEQNLPIEEFYKNINPQIERDFDEAQKEIMATEKNLIIEGRMAPFLETPFPKISFLLKVGFEEAAKRVKNRPEYKEKSIQEIAALLKGRVETEREHYKNIYGVPDHLDQAKFDVVIDTSGKKKKEVFWLILKEFKKRNS